MTLFFIDLDPHKSDVSFKINLISIIKKQNPTKTPQL